MLYPTLLTKVLHSVKLLNRLLNGKTSPLATKNGAEPSYLNLSYEIFVHFNQLSTSLSDLSSKLSSSESTTKEAKNLHLLSLVGSSNGKAKCSANLSFSWEDYIKLASEEKAVMPVQYQTQTIQPISICPATLASIRTAWHTAVV